ncbi:DUF2147 domain-containing protein [Mucilaginibacter pallidiroseus]|uniref:DUF2147 domain-containing protein n=1 Tax=Mucilaginibacter pallidiroseus TaxID=2599295 RepID=A0A563UC47_9SPHI|nr:DUF2147 domain-containing protein [Mucilaginibacter pallidiroseus]TWR28829.1 DUF2147 domain-containing protein [Mucilaginibacter pallidiroseus]
MKKLLLSILFLSFTKMLFSQSNADDIVGTWYSPVKAGKVRIYKKQQKYFGNLVELKDSVDKEEKPVLDVNNPDVTKRNSPLVGITLLSDITYDARKKRWKGKLYDYDGGKGRTFDSYLTITQSGDLNIKGFWGLSFFGLNPGLTLQRVAEK